MKVIDKRPKFLNLFLIRFPVTAILSIMHRVMGVLLVIGLPFATYLFAWSLRGANEYAQVLAILQHPLIKIVTVLMIWALSHHLLAGIRFLFIDFDWGVSKSSARISAYAVNIGAFLLALALAWRLL